MKKQWTWLIPKDRQVQVQRYTPQHYDLDPSSMDSTRPLKVCCGFCYQGVSSRSFKSYKVRGGASMDWTCWSGISHSMLNWIEICFSFLRRLLTDTDNCRPRTPHKELQFCWDTVTQSVKDAQILTCVNVFSNCGMCTTAVFHFMS